MNNSEMSVQSFSRLPREKVHVANCSCLAEGLIPWENTEQKVEKQVFAYTACSFLEGLKLCLYKHSYEGGDCWYKETLIVQMGSRFTTIRSAVFPFLVCWNSRLPIQIAFRWKEGDIFRLRSMVLVVMMVTMIIIIIIIIIFPLH